jgi:hypothetical protein
MSIWNLRASYQHVVLNQLSQINAYFYYEMRFLTQGYVYSL